MDALAFLLARQQMRCVALGQWLDHAAHLDFDDTRANRLRAGQQDRLGRVRAGFAADLIVVNGNPLENLKVLYPTGVDEIRGGKTVHTGGVEWTTAAFG